MAAIPFSFTSYDRQCAMKVLTIDETGLHKLVSVEQKVVVKWGDQSRENESRAMCWAPSAASSSSMGTVCTDSSTGVRFWDVGTQACTRELACTDTARLEFLNDSLVHVTKQGTVSIYGATSDEPVCTFDTAGNVVAARLNLTHTELAVGGDERDLELWDLESRQQSWAAKNVRHDFLDMRVPVAVDDIVFLNGAPDSSPLKRKRDSSTPAGPTNTIAVCSRHRYIRIYDTRVQRRPVQDIMHGERPWTRIAASADSRHIVVGDTTGEVLQFDVRTMKVSRRFGGPVGSIRGLSCHPTAPYVAACGLDRHLYVHNSNTGKLVGKFYLKQRLNGCVFTDELPVGALAEGTEELDDETMWQMLADNAAATGDGAGSDDDEDSTAEALSKAQAARKAARRARAASWDSADGAKEAWPAAGDWNKESGRDEDGSSDAGDVKDDEDSTSDASEADSLLNSSDEDDSEDEEADSDDSDEETAAMVSSSVAQHSLRKEVNTVRRAQDLKRKQRKARPRR